MLSHVSRERFVPAEPSAAVDPGHDRRRAAWATRCSACRSAIFPSSRSVLRLASCNLNGKRFAVDSGDASSRVGPAWTAAARAQPSAFAVASIGRVLVALSVFAPALIVLLVIARWGVNVPFGDQWELVPLLDDLSKGRVSLAGLWAQHNEHRLLVPRLGMLALARLSAWNVVWEQVLGVAGAAATWMILAAIARRTLPCGRRAVVVAAAWLTFSRAQWENWMWGWQIQIFLNVLAAVIAAWGIARWPRRRAALWLALTAGVVATFSFANGLALLWLVPLAARPPRRAVVISVLAAALVSALYLYGYHRPAGHPPLSDCLADLVRYAKFCFIYLGSPFGQGALRVAAAFGMVGLAVFGLSGWCIWRRAEAERERAVPWLLLGGYVIVSSGITGLGRAAFGLGHALASRYTTFSSLFWVATFALAALALAPVSKAGRPSGWRFVVASCAAAIAVAYGVSYQRGYVTLRVREAKLGAGRRCALEYRTAQKRCLELLHPDGDLVKERLAILERLGLGP